MPTVGSNGLAESPRRRLRPARRRDRRLGVLRRARSTRTSFEDASTRTHSLARRRMPSRHTSPASRGRRGARGQGRAARTGDGRRRLGRRLEAAPLRCPRRRAPHGRAATVAPASSATRPSTDGAGAAGRERTPMARSSRGARDPRRHRPARLRPCACRSWPRFRGIPACIPVGGSWRCLPNSTVSATEPAPRLLRDSRLDYRARGTAAPPAGGRGGRTESRRTPHRVQYPGWPDR